MFARVLIDVTVAKKRIKGIVLINFRIQIGKKWNYVFILYMPSLGVKELRPADIIAEGGATLCSDSQWESGQRAFAEFYPRYMKAKYRKIIGIVNKPPKSPISTHSPFTFPSPVFFADSPKGPDESPQQDSPDRALPSPKREKEIEQQLEMEQEETDSCDSCSTSVSISNCTSVLT